MSMNLWKIEQLCKENFALGAASRDAEVVGLNQRLDLLSEASLNITNERDQLREQVTLLRESLDSVLATRKAEAITSMALVNAEENFTDPRIEEAAFLKAANAASNAEKMAREALDATEPKA